MSQKFSGPLWPNKGWPGCSNESLRNSCHSTKPTSFGAEVTAATEAICTSRDSSALPLPPCCNDYPAAFTYPHMLLLTSKRQGTTFPPRLENYHVRQMGLANHSKALCPAFHFLPTPFFPRSVTISRLFCNLAARS